MNGIIHFRIYFAITDYLKKQKNRKSGREKQRQRKIEGEERKSGKEKKRQGERVKERGR